MKIVIIKTFDYDSNCNHIALLRAPGTAAEFDQCNQLVRDTDYEYQYDLNGNLIAEYDRDACSVVDKRAK